MFKAFYRYPKTGIKWYGTILENASMQLSNNGLHEQSEISNLLIMRTVRMLYVMFSWSSRAEARIAEALLSCGRYDNAMG